MIPDDHPVAQFARLLANRGDLPEPFDYLSLHSAQRLAWPMLQLFDEWNKQIGEGQ